MVCPVRNNPIIEDIARRKNPAASYKQVNQVSDALGRELRDVYDAVGQVMANVQHLERRIEALEGAISAIPTDIPEVVVPDHRGEIEALKKAILAIPAPKDVVIPPGQEVDMGPVLQKIDDYAGREAPKRKWRMKVNRDDWGQIDTVDVDER